MSVLSLALAIVVVTAVGTGGRSFLCPLVG